MSMFKTYMSTPIYIFKSIMSKMLNQPWSLLDPADRPESTPSECPREKNSVRPVASLLSGRKEEMASQFVHVAKSLRNGIKELWSRRWEPLNGAVCAAQCELDDSLRSMYRCCQSRFWRCPRFCSSCLPNSSAASSCAALPVSAPRTESFSSPRRSRRTPCWSETVRSAGKFAAGAVRMKISKA